MVTSSFRLGSVRMLEGGFRSNKGLVGVCGSEEGCRVASKSELVGVLRSEGTCAGSAQSELVGVLRSEGGWAGSVQSELVGVLRSEGGWAGSAQSELVGVLRSEGGWAGSAQSELEGVHAFVVVGVVSCIVVALSDKAWSVSMRVVSLASMALLSSLLPIMVVLWVCCCGPCSLFAMATVNMCRFIGSLAVVVVRFVASGSWWE